MSHVPSSHEIETASGLFVDTNNPQPETIKVEDIAHALSLTCRYGGHCAKFYCVPPETPVLTSDFKWIPAGDLRLHEGLFTFEETADVRKGVGKKPRRRVEGARVTRTGGIEREIIRLDLADGSSVRSSAEHPWLMALKAAGNQTWLSARDILARVEANRAQSIVRFVNPWNAVSSWSTGYLSGIFDGEGSAGFAPGGLGSIGMAQNAGGVLERAERVLTALGFKFVVRDNPASNCRNLTILGGWQEVARFLGVVRPQRLLDKFTARVHSDLDFGIPAQERVQVIGGASEGQGEVVALSTTSKTYIAGGFGAHNSVAEHAVAVSKRLERQGFGRDLLLAGLHHDDAEAYLGDIPRPLKPLLGQSYERLTANMDWAIGEALELPLAARQFEHARVKDADNWLLFVEARALLPSRGDGWKEGQQNAGTWGLGNLPTRIVTPDYFKAGVPWPTARRDFLLRHKELMERKDHT